MNTIENFIKRAGLRMSARSHYENPYMDDMPSGSTHWKCIIKCGDKCMGVYYSMGEALKGKPNLADLLDCIAGDASGCENSGSFENWCAEFGYDEDSRKAHRTFRIVGRQAAKLKDLLGDTLYEELLYKIDRL